MKFKSKALNSQFTLKYQKQQKADLITYETKTRMKTTINTRKSEKIAKPDTNCLVSYKRTVMTKFETIKKRKPYF